MNRIFKEFGGIIIIVAAIGLLGSLVFVLMQPGMAVDMAFKTITQSFVDKSEYMLNNAGNEGGSAGGAGGAQTPEKNEDGFYYNVPYVTELNGTSFAFVFYEDNQLLIFGEANTILGLDLEDLLPADADVRNFVFDEGTRTATDSSSYTYAFSEDGESLESQGVSFVATGTEHGVYYGHEYVNQNGDAIVFDENGTVTVYNLATNEVLFEGTVGWLGKEHIAHDSSNLEYYISIDGNVVAVGDMFFERSAMNEEEFVAGLYETGAIALYQTEGAEAIEEMLIMSWDELVSYGYMTVTNGELYHTSTLDAVPISTYAAQDGCAFGGDLILPDNGSVRSIAADAFNHNCKGLTGVLIPDSVTTIGNEAFANSGLESIAIPNGVTSIGEEAFYCCFSLVNVEISNSVTTIGDSAFANCTQLTSITIPDGVNAIAGGSFINCDSLESIVIPDSVTSIGEMAFYTCKNLNNITFGGTSSQWDAIEKGELWNYLAPVTEVKCSDGTVSLS